ncbi:MAG: low molecular weight phosphotyrosine protein phosphatase [Zoogloeaceae bacterium]|jgi:protein-tyrosine phosphatase|nr:low molecular weight phosphotyrosine protein phosphatase [Zoogloeaceae bacterium]
MTKILFVCMGNICRSPTAEGIFCQLARRRKLKANYIAHSAGTHGYHVGEPPDLRTQRAAIVRGYDLSQLRARKITLHDLATYDLILAMDKGNLDNLLRMANPAMHDKIGLFMDFSRHYDDDEVPDPYYGLGYDFDLVIDMVEDAAAGLLDALARLRRHGGVSHAELVRLAQEASP